MNKTDLNLPPREGDKPLPVLSQVRPGRRKRKFALLTILALLLATGIFPLLHEQGTTPDGLPEGPYVPDTGPFQVVQAFAPPIGPPPVNASAPTPWTPPLDNVAVVGGGFGSTPEQVSGGGGGHHVTPPAGNNSTAPPGNDTGGNVTLPPGNDTGNQTGGDGNETGPPGDGDGGSGGDGGGDGNQTGSGNETRVVLCHIPPGNPENAHTIEVGEAAVPAHLRHGDYLGACIA